MKDIERIILLANGQKYIYDDDYDHVICCRDNAIMASIFDETAGTTVERIKEMEEKSIALCEKAEQINKLMYRLKEEKKDLPGYDTAISKMDEFRNSKEYVLIYEFCNGNRENLQELIDISNGDNPWKIIVHANRKEELSDVRGELAYGCIARDYIHVGGIGGYSNGYHYGEYNHFDFEEDYKTNVSCKKNCIKKIKKYKKEITKFANEYEVGFSYLMETIEGKW